MITPAPLTRFHTCGACDCQVPDDARYDALASRHARVLTKLRESNQQLKQLRSQVEEST